MQDQPTISSQFGELIEPEPVAFSFDAPGWYVVFGLVILLLIVYGVVQVIRYRKNKYRRDALAYLVQVEKQTDQRNLIYETHVLLKRIALRKGRTSSAHLMGQDWIHYLNAQSGSSGFDEEDGELIGGIHQPAFEVATQRLEAHLAKVRHWIKNHKLNGDGPIV